MNDFIEKNKRLFRFYSSAARFIGWTVLLTVICIILIKLLTSGSIIDLEGFSMRIHMVWGLLFGYLLPVFLALLVSQLIRHITEPEYHYGWILRYGDRILFTYAVLVVLNAVWRHIYYFVISHSFNSDDPSKFFYVLISVLLTLAKVLILVGLGQIIKIIMPIIDEQKTLI